MDRFTVIQDAAVIVHASGVYRQAAVYARGRSIYCQYGAGFVRLYKNGVTGVPRLRWDEIDIDKVRPGDLMDEGLGKLSLPANYALPAPNGK